MRLVDFAVALGVFTLFKLGEIAFGRTQMVILAIALALVLWIFG